MLESQNAFSNSASLTGGKVLVEKPSILRHRFSLLFLKVYKLLVTKWLSWAEWSLSQVY